MKRLPIGIQNFEEIIETDYLYIDKTKQVLSLLDSGKYLFLSRPRRFGKSLLINILENIFHGKKELFRNLYIYDKIDWKEYPVIKLDFSKLSIHSKESLQDSLKKAFESIAEDYSVGPLSGDVKSCFGELIEKLHEKKKQKVVILIDEYDKPIIDHLSSPSLAADNREILRDVFTMMKGSDEHLHFVFLTGVTKFSQVSVFSGLNNILDISVNRELSCILGYTQDELEFYFEDRINEYCRENILSRKELLDRIRHWYNGYSWDGQNRVYNPFSILCFFQNREFRNYWFDSGTPTFLVKYIRDKGIDSSDFEIKEGSELILQNMDISGIDLTALLFQSGYLTIQSKVWDEILGSTVYTLTFPNNEVSQSFLNYILSDHIGKDVSSIEPAVGRLKTALYNYKISVFMEIMQSLISGIPYNLHIPKEAYYHSLFYMILKLIGCRINPESLSASGRVDGVLEFGSRIYIIEFKMGKAKTAMEQIKEKRYSEPYRGSGKKIILLAIGFGKKRLEFLEEEEI